MDIETPLFLAYKKYITENIDYDLDVFPKAPQSIAKFPTIVMKEFRNVDNTRAMSVDRTEYSDNLSFKIEIYTKDVVLDGKKIASKIVMNNLKYMTLGFFRDLGFRRILCEPAEYLDVTVDRLVIIEECSTQSWNNYIR